MYTECNAPPSYSGVVFDEFQDYLEKMTVHQVKRMIDLDEEGELYTKCFFATVLPVVLRPASAPSLMRVRISPRLARGGANLAIAHAGERPILCHSKPHPTHRAPGPSRHLDALRSEFCFV